jgi:hypothetical protein
MFCLQLLLKLIKNQAIRVSKVKYAIKIFKVKLCSQYVRQWNRVRMYMYQTNACLHLCMNLSSAMEINQFQSKSFINYLDVTAFKLIRVSAVDDSHVIYFVVIATTKNVIHLKFRVSLVHQNKISWNTQ